MSGERGNRFAASGRSPNDERRSAQRPLFRPHRPDVAPRRPCAPVRALLSVTGLRKVEPHYGRPGASLGKEFNMGAKLGGSGGSKFDLGQNSDINVTPFVDVMLVLLIIFMVSIPAATVSIKLDLPPAIPPPPGAKVEEPTLINIQQGGALYIGERATNLDTLTTDLATELKKPNPTEERVYIRADRTVRYGDF